MKKKTLKKVAAVLTGMLLAVSLSACGSQGGSRNNASQARGEQQDAAPKTTQEAVVSPKETQTAQETQPETTQETQLPTEADTQLQTETVDQTPAEEPSAEEPSARRLLFGNRKYGKRGRVYCSGDRRRHFRAGTGRTVQQ